MDNEDKIKTQEELYDKIYDVLEKSDLWWTDEVEILCGIIYACVSPYVEKKRLSEGEVLAFNRFSERNADQAFQRG